MLKNCFVDQMLGSLVQGETQIQQIRPIDPREHDLFDRAWI